MRKAASGNGASRELDLGDWVGTEKKKRKAGPKRIYDSALERAKALLEARRFGDFGPSELVGLYVLLHEAVYGAQPAELQGPDVRGAISAAAKLLREEFGGEPIRAVEFVRWCWARERQAERWRRREGEGGRRIGWRLQFAQRHLVTDFRVESNRRGRGKANGHA